MLTDTASGPWSPLLVQVYRWLWIAGVVSNIGTFMHLTAAKWTMTELTTSPTLVGLVETAWAVPGFLLALHAGALADMVDRRRFILITQFAALLVAASLAAAQGLGGMTPLVLLAGTFLESVALTFAAPAFMALTPELVSPTVLPQAIGLDGISRNAAQTVGPALAGGVMALAGPGAAFAFNALSFLGVMLVVRGYRPRPVERTSSAVSGAIREGVQHVARARSLRNPVLRVALVSPTGASLVALLPIVAQRRLHVDEGGFGLLYAALGLGSVAAIWLLPRLGGAVRPERATIVAALLWSAGTALLAIAEQLWMGLAALLLAGAGTMGMINVLWSNFTLQLQSWVRGRGSAVAMLMVWLGTSVGAATWGAIASGTGVQTALLAAAAFNLAVAAVNRVALPVTLYRGPSSDSSSNSPSSPGPSAGSVVGS